MHEIRIGGELKSRIFEFSNSNQAIYESDLLELNKLKLVYLNEEELLELNFMHALSIHSC